MPPKAPGSIFTLKPKSQDVPQGSVAEFVAEVAREDISVRWERDGRDFPPGGRWSVSRTSSRHHVLSVIDVRAEDAAELAVIAGGSRVRFRLQVLKPQPSVEEQQVVGGKVLLLTVNEAEEEVGSAMLEQEGGGDENLCEHRQELTGLFLEKPQNGIVQVGGELGFVARVQSELLSRKPSVRWFKGKWMDLASKVGKHLKLLETFNRNTKVYTFEMRVMDAKESFAGSYRCEVMLKEKFDSWTFELLVEEAPEPKQVMDIRAAFRKVSTTGEDSGELDFSGLLKKREQKVEASEPDEDVWELLKGANPQEYERIAFEHGVTDLRGLLHRLKRMKQEQRKSEVFLKRLDPAYQADKGGRVRLAVDLEDPNTEIKWFKNGTEIRSSGKFIMEAQGKRRILTINHCSLADDAAYEVMVGDEKCSTELFVREPPVHIVRDLDDQSCLVGDRVELFCEVSEDGAQVKWLKDGKELSREESCKFRFKKDGPKHQLIISDVCQEDNGRYSVVTSGGETHAELHVEEKPLEVIRGMADLTVNARDHAVFRCEVSEERVSGRWYKDGREVRPSEHVCISHVGRIHKLEIDGVRDDDKGDYTFVPDGHAFSLSAKLNMLEVKIDFVPRQEPPKIHLEPLEGLAENTIVVVAGNKLRLDLPISGDPTPTVIWHRGQQVISASQGRVHVESFPDHSTFVVECAERGDEDCYSIVVRNDAGEDSAQLNVKVVDVPDPPSTPSIVVLGGDWCLAEWEPPEWDGGVPLLGYVVERKKKQSYRWMRLNFDPVKQPRFEPRRMIEGATYELRVFAVNTIGTSRPSPPCQPFIPLDPPGEPTGLAVEDVSDESVTLRWKMPEQVGVTGLLGYHVEYHVDGGDEWKEACPGLVAHTNVCVSGLPTGAHVIFRVCAVNAAGPGPHGSLFQPVTVRQVVERPRVLLPRDLRQGLTRKVGETVNIVIPFQGKPTPCVLWEKDEQPLDLSAVSVRNGESDTILYIRHCERAHSGLYSLTLRLEQLTDRATIDLQVVERPSPPRAVTVEEVWSSNVSLSWQPPIDDGNAELAGYTVQKADSKSMEWFTVYDRYRRMRCVVSDLILGNAYFFRVFSENVCGLSETACTSKDSAYIQKSGLAYQRPVFQERDPSEPPQFSHSLADVVSVAGYNATLSCCVRGNPKPKVMWLRNGVDISEDPRFRMFTSQGICTLEARKPGPFDGAMFTCHATNTFGEDQTECRLTVRVSQ